MTDEFSGRGTGMPLAEAVERLARLRAMEVRLRFESGARGLLALDRGAFEVYARRVEGTPMSVECVTVTEEVVATVARDLSEYAEASNG